MHFMRVSDHSAYDLDYFVRVPDHSFVIRIKAAGFRSVWFDLWNILFGLWNTLFGLWNTLFVLWNILFGLWNTFFGLWTTPRYYLKRQEFSWFKSLGRSIYYNSNDSGSAFSQPSSTKNLSIIDTVLTNAPLSFFP